MKKTVEEMIEVMQAYSDGKEIEFRKRHVRNSKWTSIYDVTWDWVTYDYRVKPKPHYVPYDSVDEVERDKVMNVVTVRWFDGYMEVFEATEVRFGCDLLFMRLTDGTNRQIPLRHVRWFGMTKESHQKTGM